MGRRIKRKQCLFGRICSIATTVRKTTNISFALPKDTSLLTARNHSFAIMTTHMAANSRDANARPGTLIDMKHAFWHCQNELSLDDTRMESAEVHSHGTHPSILLEYAYILLELHGKFHATTWSSSAQSTLAGVCISESQTPRVDSHA